MGDVVVDDSTCSDAEAETFSSIDMMTTTEGNHKRVCIHCEDGGCRTA